MFPALQEWVEKVRVRTKTLVSVQDTEDSRQPRNLEKMAWGPDFEAMSSRSPKSPLEATRHPHN